VVEDGPSKIAIKDLEADKHSKSRKKGGDRKEKKDEQTREGTHHTALSDRYGDCLEKDCLNSGVMCEQHEKRFW
jgi:hypothetical protein